MSHVLLINDNEVVNSLYEVNINAYVGADLTIKRSADQAISLLEQTPNLDVIIINSNLSSDESDFKKINAIRPKDLPVISIGSKNLPFQSNLQLTNKYDIKKLLRSLAQLFQITAKDMLEHQVPSFFPIPTQLISKMSALPSDIYCKVPKTGDELGFDYFIVAKKSGEVGEVITKKLEEGEEYLYIDSDFRLSFINQASELVLEELKREDLTVDEAIDITNQAMEVVADQVFDSDEANDKVDELSKACMKSIHQTVKEVPKLKGLLALLTENKTGYVYKHSIIATFVATRIIDNISWGSKEQQEKIAFTLFFHDLFLVKLYAKYPHINDEEDFLFDETVEDADKQIVLEHARHASSIIKTIPRAPIGADAIALQHHGMTNGLGFAVNFRDDISPLAKVILISEDVTSDILRAKREALKFNKDSTIARLLEKYKSSSYKKIVEALKDVEF